MRSESSVVGHGTEGRGHEDPEAGLLVGGPLLVSQPVDYAAKVHPLTAFPCLLGN